MRVCRCSLRALASYLRSIYFNFNQRTYLIYQIFFYNHDDSSDLRIDTIFQPIFSSTNRLAKYVGKIFITFFLVIISVAVYLFYTSIFVHLYNEIGSTDHPGQHGYFTFFSHILISHWLLINIMFNYGSCVLVDPGRSPNFGSKNPHDFDKSSRDRMKIHQESIDRNNNKPDSVTILNLNDQVSINHRNPLSKSNNILEMKSSTTKVCRKCIFPKPTRSHHCSICNRCILNQDHHCPWINNCVGHLNHRYFFQFCFFMTLGSVYAASFGFTEYQHYIFGEKVVSYIDLLLGKRLQDFELMPHVTDTSNAFMMLFLFFVAVTASFILCGFTVWHFFLVSTAQTTIDFYMNSEEKKRLKKTKQIFINPYDLGFALNWKMFLGINQWHEMIYRNLIPSRHRPFCDGINWPIRKGIRLNDRPGVTNIQEV